MSLFDKWRKRQDRQPSQVVPGVETRKPGESQAIIIDPWEIQQNQQYIDTLTNHSPSTASTLKSLSETPFVTIFIRYFQNKLALFTRPQQGRFGLGFRIVTREEKKSPSRAALKEIDRLTRLAQTCGEFTNEGVERFTRPDFASFAKCWARDSAVFDAGVFEVCQNRKRKPGSWRAVDGSTIFRVQSKTPYELMAEDDAAFVQVVNGQPAAYWPASDMSFTVRCPSTDIRSGGYGRPELVELLGILNQILSAYVANTNLMKQGGPRGLLAMLGDMPADKFDAMVRGIRSYFAGVRNMGRTPVVNLAGQGADMKWITTDMANFKDMQFVEMLQINFQILCSHWGVAPEEVGFYYGNYGQSSTLSSGGINDKVQQGLARGLYPFAYAFEAAMNRHVWYPLTDDEFEFRCMGLEGRTEKEQAELDEIRARTYCTQNEIRAEHNMQARDDGEVVLNGVWFQNSQALAANAQQDEGGDDAQDGDPDGGSDAGAADDSGAPRTSPRVKTPAKDPTTDWGDEPAPKDETKKSLSQPSRWVIEL